MTAKVTNTGNTDGRLARSKAVSDELFIVLVVVGGMAVAFSLAVAINGFAWGLPDAGHVQSYHPDEQNITYSLRNMRPREFDLNPRFFGNPTFYTYQVGALALVASTVGLLPGELDEAFWLTHPEALRRFYILGRGLSALYAALSVLMMYSLAKRLTADRRAALVAALIFAALPVTAVHSHYMTVNPSAVFWSLAALLYALKLRETHAWKHYCLAGLFAGLAISTKLNNALLPLAILAAHLQATSGGRLGGRLLSGRLWTAAVICIAAFVAGSPYYLFSLTTVAADAHNRMNFTALASFAQPLAVMLHDFCNHMSAACGPVLAAVLLVSLPTAFGRLRGRAAPLLAAAVPFTIVAVKSGFWAFPSRMWPLLALFSVLAVAAAWREKARMRWHAGAVVVIAAGLLFTIPWNAAYLGLQRGEHIRSASSRWIVENIPAGSTILVLDTPYYDDPDVVYENALHAATTTWPHYKIVNLAGNFNQLSPAKAEWLVIPQRIDYELRKRGDGGAAALAKAHGFEMVREFRTRFAACGIELRDWVPADMVQDYPVFVFRRAPDGAVSDE